MRARALDSYLLCRVYARLDIVCCGVFVLAEGDAAVYAQQTLMVHHFLGIMYHACAHFYPGFRRGEHVWIAYQSCDAAFAGLLFVTIPLCFLCHLFNDNFVLCVTSGKIRIELARPLTAAVDENGCSRCRAPLNGDGPD